MSHSSSSSSSSSVFGQRTETRNAAKRDANGFCNANSVTANSSANRRVLKRREEPKGRTPRPFPALLVASPEGGEEEEEGQRTTRERISVHAPTVIQVEDEEEQGTTAAGPELGLRPPRPNLPAPSRSVQFSSIGETSSPTHSSESSQWFARALRQLSHSLGLRAKSAAAAYAWGRALNYSGENWPPPRVWGQEDVETRRMRAKRAARRFSRKCTSRSLVSVVRKEKIFD